MNGHLRCNIVSLARSLGEAASSLFSPGSILVIDESLYEFNGTCPVRRYIPRKPHPNGLLAYGLAGFVNIGSERIPFLLDFEPYMLGNEVGPHEAMLRLHSRLRARKPELRPHLVVDSAFGSFERLAEINEAGGDATMSMPATVKPWLWEMLDWRCGVDEGRAAYLPQQNIIVGSFKVLSEAGRLHQIKTISSGCQLEEIVDAEAIVLKVSDRRDAGDQLEYLTHFADGHTEWLLAQQFIDDDGTTNSSWLSYVNDQDLEKAFATYSLSRLKVLAT